MNSAAKPMPEDADFPVYLSECLRTIALREPNDDDRCTVMLCAGYLRGVAFLQREIVAAQRTLAVYQATINAQEACIHELQRQAREADGGEMYR
jgi:hypothetical protein